MVVPVVRVVQRHRDDRPAVPLSCRHQTAPGSARESGLDADRVLVQTEQTVVVDERAAGSRAGFRRHDVAEHRVAQRGGGDLRKLACGRVVAVRRQSARVFETGVRQAKLARLCIHLVYKRPLAAAFSGHSRRRIVARGEQQAVKRVAQRQPFAFFEVHRRAFYGRVLLFHRVHAVEVALAERDERGHDLCRGRHRQTAVRIFREQGLPRIRIHRDRRRRTERRRARQQRRADPQREPQLFHAHHSPCRTKPTPYRSRLCTGRADYSSPPSMGALSSAAAFFFPEKPSTKLDTLLSAPGIISTMTVDRAVRLRVDAEDGRAPSS